MSICRMCLMNRRLNSDGLCARCDRLAWTMDDNK